MDKVKSKKWIWPEKVPENVEMKLEGFSSLEQQLLIRRDVLSTEDAQAFLENQLTTDDDPFQLKDMGTAVERILLAKENGEQVVIYGDYDADGITATVVLMETLKAVGLNSSFYIPDRMTEGYGLHDAALNKLHSAGAKLVITVDCGIRAVEEAIYANSLGLDIIVTDHHAPGPEIPDVVAIINPKQEDDEYPFDGFAGVGLAYKLSQALMRSQGKENIEDLLELVAIGTIADLAPLRDENRYLVALGLERMNRTQRIGLKALMGISRLNNKIIITDSVGFALGPRINAAGRLDDAAKAVELFLTKDVNEAKALAQELDEINRRRQKLTRVIVEQARQQVIEKSSISSVIFASDESFHEGIVGLAASRLSDEFFRPAIVATLGVEFTRGSARSIPGINITQAFDQCAEILVQYGGHSAAAGFTVKTSQLNEFKEQLDLVTKEALDAIDPQPTIVIDAEAIFSDITLELLTFVENLQPCGIGNLAPTIGSKNIEVVSKRCVGKDKSHLKLMLKGNGRLFDAIAFRKGSLYEDLPKFIDVAYRIERNVYMGYENIQLNVQEIRF